MANCANCKKPVGCGCNLRNGLCAQCAVNKANKEAEEAQKKQQDPNDPK